MEGIWALDLMASRLLPGTLVLTSGCRGESSGPGTASLSVAECPPPLPSRLPPLQAWVAWPEPFLTAQVPSLTLAPPDTAQVPEPHWAETTSGPV